jgi:hypothetical protein
MNGHATAADCTPSVVTVCPAGTRMQVNGTCLAPSSGGTTVSVAGQGTTPTVVRVGPVPAVGTPTSPSALPFTGTNALRFLELAGLLLLVGLGLVIATRRPVEDEL